MLRSLFNNWRFNQLVSGYMAEGYTRDNAQWLARNYLEMLADRSFGPYPTKPVNSNPRRAAAHMFREN